MRRVDAGLTLLSTVSDRIILPRGRPNAFCCAFFLTRAERSLSESTSASRL